ncbi:hypothetical protein ABUE31_22665, partial [Mesorhizobium sp. ZMM04-5]
MWFLLSRKAQLAIVAIAILVTIKATEGAYLWFTDNPGTFLQRLSVTLFIVGSVLTLSAEVFWFRLARIVPALQRFTFPDLNGSWNGHLHSTWVNPETGQ